MNGLRFDKNHYSNKISNLLIQCFYSIQIRYEENIQLLQEILDAILLDSE